MGKKRFIIVGIALLVVVGFIGLLLAFSPSPPSRGRDVVRLSDIAAVKSSIALYVSDTGMPYPRVNGESPHERWAQLGRVILNMEYPPLSEMPYDPVDADPLVYDYQANEDGTQCVFKATFENINYYGPRFLSDDVDGTVYGIQCGDPNNDQIYCVWCRVATIDPVVQEERCLLLGRAAHAERVVDAPDLFNYRAVEYWYSHQDDTCYYEFSSRLPGDSIIRLGVIDVLSSRTVLSYRASGGEAQQCGDSVAKCASSAEEYVELLAELKD